MHLRTRPHKAHQDRKRYSLIRLIFYLCCIHPLVMSNRDSIYNLAKYRRINHQDLNLLFRKMLFEQDLHVKVCVCLSCRLPAWFILSRQPSIRISAYTSFLKKLDVTFSAPLHRLIVFKKKKMRSSAPGKMVELKVKPLIITRLQLPS